MVTSWNDTLVFTGGGFLGGILLDDIWEILHLPGYFVPTGLSFTGPTGVVVNIGYDDVAEAGIGALLAISPYIVRLFKNPLINAAIAKYGLGSLLGTLATIVGDYYGFPLQIIPHTNTPP